ncbi:hypothetical protein [uncultured Alteromonas sp.]|uniref:hypothetical protein n=1 Tax=uncultured Alteromonas sp. TaxID=179113 RepID=UPI0030CBD93C
MIKAYTNDDTLMVRDEYSLKCHEPLPVPVDNIDIGDFFDRWEKLTTTAFDGLPSFIRDSFEVRALSKLITNQQFKNSAKRSVEYHDSVREGLLSMMESGFINIMPTTAKQEFFAFMQYAISPYSHLYTDCDAILINNGNLMDMLLIGHHQFDVLIFDRGLVDSHAISFALKLGLPVVVTTDELIFSQNKRQMRLTREPQTNTSFDRALPFEVNIEVISHPKQVKGYEYG